MFPVEVRNLPTPGFEVLSSGSPLVASFGVYVLLVVAEVQVFLFGEAVEGGGDAVVLLMWELLEDFLLVGYFCFVFAVVLVGFGCSLVG